MTVGDMIGASLIKRRRSRATHQFLLSRPIPVNEKPGADIARLLRLARFSIPIFPLISKFASTCARAVSIGVTMRISQDELYVANDIGVPPYNGAGNRSEATPRSAQLNMVQTLTNTGP